MSESKSSTQERVWGARRAGGPGIAVVAMGGNSLISDPQHQDVGSQWNAVRETCVHLADMVEAHLDTARLKSLCGLDPE